MKAPLALLAALFIALPLGAQVPATPYTPEQLDQLAGPIALYPDALVALILPASSAPADVTAAAQYLANGGDPSQVDAQPWDPSVRGLAHYPTVVKWMNDNLNWTEALGAAFAMQPSDVMKSIQQLRVAAKAAGTLVNTPQQRVEEEGDNIRIIPAQDNVLYVPSYDPEEVYDAPEGAMGDYLTFDVGYPVGPWLGFECDWDDFGIWVAPWHSGWGYRRDWNDPHFGGKRWHPDADRGHELVRNFYNPREALPRPGRIAQGNVHSQVAPRGQAPAPGREAPAPRRETPAPGYSETRGYPPATARPASPAPSSPVLGGYERGSQTRDYSSRGQTSRQAPVAHASSSPHSEPSRSSAPSRSEPSQGGKDRR